MRCAYWEKSTDNENEAPERELDEGGALGGLWVRTEHGFSRNGEDVNDFAAAGRRLSVVAFEQPGEVCCGEAQSVYFCSIEENQLSGMTYRRQPLRSRSECCS